MKKYEYGQLYEDKDCWEKIWMFKTTGGEVRSLGDSYYLLEVLDKLGNNGWELVLYDKEDEEYILKREIS